MAYEGTKTVSLGPNNKPKSNTTVPLPAKKLKIPCPPPSTIEKQGNGDHDVSQVCSSSQDDNKLDNSKTDNYELFKKSPRQIRQHGIQ